MVAARPRPPGTYQQRDHRTDLRNPGGRSLFHFLRSLEFHLSFLSRRDKSGRGREPGAARRRRRRPVSPPPFLRCHFLRPSNKRSSERVTATDVMWQEGGRGGGDSGEEGGGRTRIYSFAYFHALPVIFEQMRCSGGALFGNVGGGSITHKPNSPC